MEIQIQVIRKAPDKSRGLFLYKRLLLVAYFLIKRLVKVMLPACAFRM